MQLLEKEYTQIPSVPNFYTLLYGEIKQKVRNTHEFIRGSQEESRAIFAAFNKEIADNPLKYQGYWNNKYCFDISISDTSPLLKISGWALVSNGLTGYFEKKTFGGYDVLGALALYDINVTDSDLKKCSTGYFVSTKVLCEICEVHCLPTGLNLSKKGVFTPTELHNHQKLIEITGMRI